MTPNDLSPRENGFRIPRVAHQVSYREALVIAYLHWLGGIAKYHMADIRALMTEVFDVDARLEDAEIMAQGCAKLRNLLERAGVPLPIRRACNLPNPAKAA